MQSVPGQPLFLNAKCVVGSGASSGVNAKALINPMGRPMEILGISWQLDIPTNVVGRCLGGIVACKLDMGQYPLTNGFVPIWCFGRSEQLEDESLRNRGTVTNPDGTTNEVATQSHLWRLPRPLFVPAGAVVVPNFQHRGLFQQEIAVNIGYICRSMPAGYEPAKIQLPYAASFVTKNFELSAVNDAANGYEVSSSAETDLANIFDEDLNLQRFTGRAFTFSNSLPQFTDEGGYFLAAWPDVATSVRIVDSMGNPIIKNYTAFRSAFAGMTRSWEMDAGQMMRARSYYNVDVKLTAIGDARDGLAYTSQAFVGLTGWRELK